MNGGGGRRSVMKLKERLPDIEARYKEKVNDDAFQHFLKEGLENHWFTKDHAVWAAAILRDTLYSPAEICEWYDKYGCNDSHISTVFKHFLKRKGLI